MSPEQIEIARLRAENARLLLAVGDEDDPCLDTNLFVKRTMRASQLWVVPGNEHAVNHRLTR